VASAIKHLWASTKFSTKKVVLGVANQKVIVRQVDLPWLPEEELRQSLAFQAQDYIPIPVDQAILDFHPIADFMADSGSRMMRVLLVAAVRDMVLSAVDATTKAGLSVAQVDLTPFAVLRSAAQIDALGLASRAHSEGEAVVDIGSKVTNIVVHQNGAPRFVRVLLMGGDNVTEAVAERMGVPVEQAEGVKQQMGLASTPGVPESDHPAARVVESTGAALVEEIRSSLDYYLAQPQSTPLSRIVVSGGGARLGGLLPRLALATRLPVTPASPLSSLKVGKTGLSSEQLSYVEPLVSVPVGLAMGVAS
jgi:type IV pilus assembly protein PilM